MASSGASITILPKVSNAVTIGALAKLVPVSQIVFGTDYPYRTGAEHVKGLAANFNAADLKAIDRDNARCASCRGCEPPE